MLVYEGTHCFPVNLFNITSIEHGKKALAAVDFTFAYISILYEIFLNINQKQTKNVSTFILHVPKCVNI